MASEEGEADDTGSDGVSLDVDEGAEDEADPIPRSDTAGDGDTAAHDTVLAGDAGEDDVAELIDGVVGNDEER